MHKKILQSLTLGIALFGLTVGLAACGNSANTTESSSSSTSQLVKTSAYDKANKQIKAGQFDDAMSTLKNAKQDSKVQNLKDDLATFIQARDAYKAKDHDGAMSRLTTLKNNRKSSSKALSEQITKLVKKVNSTKKGKTSQSTSSDSTTSSSNKGSQSVSESVISSFAKAAGYYGKSGYSFMVTAHSGSNYTIEVRQNNAANDVSNLVGIYQFNFATKAVSKTN